jgi:hypothetical protein
VAVHVVRPSGGVGLLRAGRLRGTPADAHVRLAAPCLSTLADEEVFVHRIQGEEVRLAWVAER